jgi:hypothetical protein
MLQLYRQCVGMTGRNVSWPPFAAQLPSYRFWPHAALATFFLISGIQNLIKTRR